MKKSWRLWPFALFLVLFSQLPLRQEAVREPAVQDTKSAPRAAAMSGNSTPHAQLELSGQVSGAGRPVPDALVCLACTGCEAIAGPPSACTHSDRTGHYLLSDIAPGAYRVQASASGFLPFSADATGPLWISADQPRRVLDIALAAGGVTLSGVVLDATGGPISRAHVRAVRVLPPQYVLESECDDDGQFQLSAAAGPVVIVARAPGYAPADTTVTAPTRDLTLMLTPGASISGHVLTPEGFPAASGIEVRAIATRNRSDLLVRSALTDDSGAYRIDGLEPGDYTLLARALHGLADSPVSIDVDVAEHISGVDLTLTAAAAVRGKVSKLDGSACTHGWAALRALAGEAAAHGVLEQVAEIAADGRLEFPGVARGRYAVAIHCFGQVLQSGPELITVSDQSLEEGHWIVAAGGSISVSVVDSRRQPVPFATFTLHLPVAANGGRAFTFYSTDQQGRVEIDALAAGSYQLAAAGSDAVTVVVRDGDPQPRATLVLAGSALIHVEVADERAQPVDNVRVTARAEVADGTRPALQLATALGAGRFRIGPVPDGTYAVRVDDGVNPVIERSVSSAASGSLRVLLARTGTVRGRVLSEHGQPQANVWLSASAHSASPLSPSPRRVLSDARGSFELTGLDAAGRYLLRAVEPAGSAITVHDVSPSDAVTIHMPPAAALRGRVVDSAGQPVQRFTLHATLQHSGGAITRSYQHADGEFELERLAPGNVQLTAESASGALALEDLLLAPGQRLDGVLLEARSRQELAAAEPATSDQPNAQH